jgi:uncharacterized protein (TIGR03435 family)
MAISSASIKTMRSFAVYMCMASLSFAFAQQATDGPKFEVASVKASDPNPSSPMFMGMSADRAIVKYTNVTLRDCICGAYKVRDFQITGPGWMTSARFEISAKLPSGASTDLIPEMLQALLADRFKLEVRREMKEQNVYALVAANGGARLKPAAGVKEEDGKLPMALGPDGKPRLPMQYGFAPGGMFIRAPFATIASLVWLMSRFTARPVVDMTGIEGQYEFDLTFSPDAVDWSAIGLREPNSAQTAVEPAPSVFDAVKKYGLRLEARKAPIEMLVITHLERMPTEN